MVPFLLEIRLRSPIIFGHRLMLDSLLLGAARERFGNDPANRTLLLRSRTGLLHASQVMAGTPEVPLVRSTTYIQSFIRVLTNEPEITDMLIRQPSPSSMSYGSGANSNVESVYVTHNIPVIYFLGVGDLPRIRALLLTVVHVGSQAHKGNGEVERATVTEVDADPRWFGIVGRHHGRRVVLRPVPTRLVHWLPAGTSGFDNTETWNYPYFSGHPNAVVEPCLVPPFANADTFHRDEISKLYRY